jgi:GxxExxY protein
MAVRTGRRCATRPAPPEQGIDRGSRLQRGPLVRIRRQEPVRGPGRWYKGRSLPFGFRADILVADAVLGEVKAVAALLPAHDAQVLTWLRMSHIRIGLLMNFHATRLKDGLRRFIV